ncbi:MAG: YbaB/EbfC family nucleoid-associated protein [Anaerolineales bacterium]|nr:YbaB/EbfC family nucleoid-associated protein [Anaerolineales bacterium]
MTFMRGNRPPPGMNQGLAERMQKLQEDMRAMHEALAAERFSATAGGGAVKVTVSGQQRVVAIEIVSEALGDGALLADMIVVATNAALEESQTVAAERLQALGPAIGLPGLGL